MCFKSTRKVYLPKIFYILKALKTFLRKLVVIRFFILYNRPFTTVPTRPHIFAFLFHSQLNFEINLSAHPMLCSVLRHISFLKFYFLPATFWMNLTKVKKNQLLYFLVFRDLSVQHMFMLNVNVSQFCKENS